MPGRAFPRQVPTSWSLPRNGRRLADAVVKLPDTFA